MTFSGIIPAVSSGKRCWAIISPIFTAPRPSLLSSWMDHSTMRRAIRSRMPSGRNSCSSLVCGYCGSPTMPSGKTSGASANISTRRQKSLPLVPKGRWHEVPEGIRTGGHCRLTTPPAKLDGEFYGASPLELPAKADSSRILQSVSLRLPAPLHRGAFCAAPYRNTSSLRMSM